jgi:acetyl-CoA/propionyl-CoA carboxylase, biotin carboxylase, biotin carboxyl carrier protein
MIRRVLVANRGEIALRVMRTCRAMGVATVAVYSEADADAPHVAAADQAVPIGPAPATESYLDTARILDAAARTQADAVHPGYGFLSENAAFAERCEAAGLTFIGPSAAVIRRMGSKTAAREAAQAAGVPVVPGALPEAQTDAALAAAVREVGLPALLKAAAGGGGKGMRVVRDEAEIDEAIAAARQESRRAFADEALYVERLIDQPRHIEVQIFGDTRGSVVHLLERDCSLQRRHQKVIEEAPAPRLSDDVRQRITQAAVDAARGVGYVNAGTIEFLVEGSDDDARFYFLEMNTRLQVEHPVTEMITGFDLVQAQILVASGEPLPFRQDDVAARGHAIECRVYAEDARRLLPQSGRLLRYREPSGDGIRVDSGVREGQRVTVHYDPLLAKLIAHGETREIARERLLRAIGGFEILGLRHNLALLAALLRQPEVVESRTHTRFIEERLALILPDPGAAVREAAAALAAFVSARQPAPAAAGAGSLGARPDPWDTLGPITW